MKNKVGNEINHLGIARLEQNYRKQVTESFSVLTETFIVIGGMSGMLTLLFILAVAFSK